MVQLEFSVIPGQLPYITGISPHLIIIISMLLMMMMMILMMMMMMMMIMIVINEMLFYVCE